MVSVTADPKADLAEALAHAARLLGQNPKLAADQAAEILRVIPGQPEATLLLGSAYRAQGQLADAHKVLSALAQRLPDWPEAHFELAQTQAAATDRQAAIASLRKAVALQPMFAEAWRALGEQLGRAGDLKGSDAAFMGSVDASTHDPNMVRAANALIANELAITERLMRDQLNAHPTDIAAMRMLAEVASRLGRYGDAEKLLARSIELAPSFAAARFNYAAVLYRMNKPLESLQQTQLLLEQDPGDPNYAALKAAALSRLSEYEGAIELYGDVLKLYGDQPKIWMSYGHVLKTANRVPESIDAYRRAITLAPHFGEAWWSLANLKTFAFTDADIASMRAALEKSDLEEADRLHLHYALGKALEDRSAYAQSFADYAQGAALRRPQIDYDADENHQHVERSKAVFTPSLFAAYADAGEPARDPIFIIGLPRSGSTLIEQVLASHSFVEGTIELPDVAMIAKRIGERKKRSEVSKYPEMLNGIDRDALRQLGQDYLDRTRAHRKTDRPIFIDKMPNNFAHVGLIHMMLPNAKIIDARRNPMATCFSAFKQHFARGQAFTYTLDELGRYYRDYVELMAHYDAVLPGRVHRVFYENMVANTEAEIRKLLHYCGLDFEPACLRFYENDRPVRTASSEQVRQPIFTSGVDHWRRYEPWLEPLKQALGDVLTAYPAVPANLAGRN